MATRKKLKRNIKICNCKNDMPHGCKDIIVDRRSPVGNPFYMVNESYRDMVCNKYKSWFITNSYTNGKVQEYLERIYKTYMMYGHVNLFCNCAPKRCHGETIKEHIWKMYKERNSALPKK